MSAILILSLLLNQQQPSQPTLREPLNPRLEQVDQSGTPVGWRIAPGAAGSSYRIESVPHAGGRAARLFRQEPPKGAGSDSVAVVQSIDATPYRGRLVRFGARVRAAKPGLLRLRVTRPGPKAAGFHDVRQISPGDWATYEVIGRVAPDARVVAISFEAQGDADLLFDDISLTAVDPNPAPPSEQAAAYLQTALQLLRQHHADRATADWVKIERDARVDIGGAMTPADTYGAIRGVLGALGEKHTMLVSPDVVRSRIQGRPATGAPVDVPMPTVERVGGRFGAVRLPEHIGPPEAGLRYTQTLRSGLTGLDAQGVCGWIVDVRGNSGGNMWPMMNGLDPLLGGAPFGSFHYPSGEVNYWSRTSIGISPGPRADGPPSFTLKAADRPVAILIDDQTMSSGEMVAIGFLGRSGVRTFGARSGGYTTANRPFPLPDGAFLVITTSSVKDRVGRDYPDGIAPDEASHPAAADAAALRWLESQPCLTGGGAGA